LPTTFSYTRYNSYAATVSDIPYIVELAKQESLPTEARDQMFRKLSQMVPQFGNVVEAEN
jgi:hypothetical protein